MRKMFIATLMVTAVLTGATSASAGTQTAAASTSLTVYSQNLALVRTTLDRILGPGEHTVRIDGLPANLDQNSLLVLSPGVTLLGAHGFRTYQSAAGNGASMDLDLAVDQQTESLALAFLTGGMSWSASYSMIVAPDDASARVDGYATVVNNSGTGFDDAEVQLLAGTINTGGRSDFRAFDEVRAMAEMAPAPAPELFEQAFAGYHLYELSERLTLRGNESRRVRMTGAESATTVKEHVLAQQFNYYQQYGEPTRQPVGVRYRVQRPEGTEFGDVPLPAGQVRIYQRDPAGRLQLLGISGIGNTPKDQELLLTVGLAFDIVATRTQVDYARPASSLYESTWRVELDNESDEDVTVQVIERLSGDWEILESTHTAQQLSAGAVRFDVEVPTGGEATLEYRIRVRS